MGQKGLFELFVVLIMLVLLLPVATHRAVISTPNTLVQADSLALLTDFAISDALYDQVIINCNLDGATVNSKISPYLLNLKNEFNETSGTECNPGIVSASLISGTDYSGYIDLNCNSNSKSSQSNIVKRLNFSKKMNVVKDTNLYTCEEKCQINIKDNLESGYPVFNYTNIESIPGCTPYVVFEDQFKNLDTREWETSKLYKAAIDSEKLLIISNEDTFDDFSSAAKHTFSPRLSGDFTITTDLELDGSDASQQLLYIEGSDGDAYVGIEDDGVIKPQYVIDINGTSSTVKAGPIKNITLIIKRAGNNMTVVIIKETGTPITITNPFIGGIISVSLVNTKLRGSSGKEAKWDYLLVQDQFV